MNYYLFMNLTVVVPFYNEEKFLKESVSKLESVKVAKYIYLVDDCSTDNSLAVAKGLTKKYENVKLFTKNINEGKGSCLKYIQNQIETTHLIMHDADLEQNPFNISDIFNIAKENKNSLIIGSRTLGKANRIKKYKLLALANFILSVIFNLLHFSRISDISSGYIMYPVDFINSINIKEKGFGIEVEIISKFVKSNKNIIEIPIDYLGRTYADGKKIKISDGFNIFFKILKYRFTD
jgi:glycosyltransferase involved in cell wall biosynthesis